MSTQYPQTPAFPTPPGSDSPKPKSTFSMGVGCLVLALVCILFAVSWWWLLIPAGVFIFLAFGMMMPDAQKPELDPTQPLNPTKRKRAWWFWPTAVLVLGLFVLFSKCGGPTEPVPPVPTGTTSESTPAATASTSPPQPTPSVTSQSTATPAPSTTTTAPPTSTTTVSRTTAGDIEAFLKESYGISAKKSWVSLCDSGSGFYPYPCAISGMTFEYGILHISVQEKLSKEDAEQYANYALNFLCATDNSAKQFKGVEWVEIRDTSGGARGQMPSSKNFLCQKNR